MNWFKTISGYYKAGFYTVDQVKIFVSAPKPKLTTEEFQAITGQAYVA